MDQVGESSGGCNPWPILEEDKTETDSEIKISYEFLKESSKLESELASDLRSKTHVISISNDFSKINSYLICSTRQIKYEFGSEFPEVRWLSETASP